MDALFRYVQAQGRIKYYNGGLFSSGVKTEVDETNGKLDETIILKAFNQFTRSAVPMALQIAGTNTFKHIRRELVWLPSHLISVFD